MMLSTISLILLGTVWRVSIAQENRLGCEFDSLEVYQPSINATVDKKNCGREFSAKEWAPEPNVTYPMASDDYNYLLFMVDPNLAGYANGEYFLHWNVANINGTSIRGADLSNGMALASYIGPAPADGSGLHHYTFLLYEQNPDLTITKEESREHFNLSSWINTVNETSKLRGPVAGTQFIVNAG